jgi:hypothetical protein
MSAVMKVLMSAGAVVLAGAMTAGSPSAQQPGMRGMGPGGMHDPEHMKDMQMFHELLAERGRITRTVTVIGNGVDTVTESDDAKVAGLIRAHVVSMTARVEQARPIHMRDPLFRALFANADRIVMKHENTAKGVRVIETSADPYVAKLIQAHAAVVSAFLANGFEEMHKNHDVPTRDP